MMFKHVSLREQLRKATTEAKRLRADVGEPDNVSEEDIKKLTLFEIEDINADYLIDLDFRLTLIELEG